MLEDQTIEVTNHARKRYGSRLLKKEVLENEVREGTVYLAEDITGKKAYSTWFYVIYDNHSVYRVRLDKETGRLVVVTCYEYNKRLRERLREIEPVSIEDFLQ